MQLILFGAGASTFCCDCEAPRPPLGDSLYRRLAEAVPDVTTALAVDARRAFEERPFEEAMDVAWRQGSKSVTPLLRQLARYLVSFEPCGCKANAYARILAAAADRLPRIMFSSLNYDVMFERLVRARQLRCIYGEGPAGVVRLYKPHGSANILPVMDRNNRITNCTFENMEGGYIGDMSMQVSSKASDFEAWYNNPENLSLGPVMSVYATGKRTPFNMPWMELHRKRWAYRVERAKRIVIVGVRYVPDDVHIWEPIERSQAAVTYVNPSNHDREQFAHWRASTGNKTPTELVPVGFSDAVPLILRRILA